MIDIAARELSLDLVEVRLKNFDSGDQMPYEATTGCLLDGGDYP